MLSIKSRSCDEARTVSDGISFTSNGVLTDSVTGGDGDPLGPVVNPKGGGVRYPREVKS